MEQESTSGKSQTLTPTTDFLPQVVFNPQLYLQRRSIIHSILRKLSAQHNFSGGLRSLLDVGCGSEILLLRSLIPCEDALPIELLTGIDISDDIKGAMCVESISPGAWTGSASGEDRWRPLDIVLLHGDFKYLSPTLIPRHDIIVSSEVIEHLDPEPLSLYASSLLGTMKPKICIITTPNRDFNPMFDINFSPRDETGIESIDPHKFWRKGISYPMRHHDHRFEWTRAEFRAWARNAAEQFGYKVEFTGVGSFGYSMMIENVDAEVVKEYLIKDMSGRVDGPKDADYFPLEPVDGSLAKEAHSVYGECTQIAVFVIKPDKNNMDYQGLYEGVSLKQALKVLPTAEFASGGISVVKHVKHPWVNYPYPPRIRDALVLVQHCLNQFIPTPVYDDWSNPPVAEWNKPHNISISELDLDDEDHITKRTRKYDELENEKHYMTQLLQGKNLADLEVLVVPVELKCIWDFNWKLQRMFRFNYQMFAALFHLGGAPGWKLNDMMPLGTKWDEAAFDGKPQYKDYKIYISTQGFRVEYNTPQNPVIGTQPGSFPFPYDSYDTEEQPNIWADFTFTPGIVPKTCDEDDRIVLTLGKNGATPVAGYDQDMCGEDILWVTFRKGVVLPS